MKVLLFNGSPNENGCTDAALRHMSKVLTERNIQTEIFQIGRRSKGRLYGLRRLQRYGQMRHRRLCQ